MDSGQLIEELEALEAIYPELVERRPSGIIWIAVPQHELVKVQLSFPSDYPITRSPNVLDVVGDPGLDTKYLKLLFQEVMESVFHSGEVCVFDFLTEVDGVLHEDTGAPDASQMQSESSQALAAAAAEAAAAAAADPLKGWSCSDPVSDRGSTFMGFAAHATSEEEAFRQLEQLKMDSKLRKANHIMSAWRIRQIATEGTRELIFQDSDDDGETAAGSRMLHLITIMDVWNVIVVVARWFGGVHIGPDRFKHINSTAREAVLNAGFEPRKTDRKS